MRPFFFGRFGHRRHTGAHAEFIVAGLGNPGREYERTRHNVGFWVVDGLAARWQVKLSRLKFKSLYGEASFDGKKIILLKPQTFMNNSGEALRECAAFYKLPWERVIVVYDDMALPAGRLRVRAKGSDGGHNGIKSILYHAQTDIFPRVKVGVGAPPHPEMDKADWVLSVVPEAEYKLMPLDKAQDAVEAIMAHGVTDAMNRYNA